MLLQSPIAIAVVSFIIGLVIGLYSDGTIFLDPSLIRLKKRRDHMLPQWLRNRY